MPTTNGFAASEPRFKTSSERQQPAGDEADRGEIRREAKEIVLQKGPDQSQDLFIARMTAATGGASVLILVCVIAYLAATGQAVPAYIAGLLGLLLGVPLQPPGGASSGFVGLFSRASRKDSPK